MINGYLEKCYAGWLAKLVGIRLGAPMEGWTYDRIAKELGEIDGYVCDMKGFCADDDSNGPMIFIRALNDASLNASSADIGRAWLDYAPYEHGFFWWGGYGVSTEHTAYLNLKNGIPAPRSGSIAQNGAAVAEQIGGQIFIDTWGLVFPGDPARAADYASRAARVSHDGDGAFGGMYIASAIAAAFTERSLRGVMEIALARIPETSGYAKVVRAVMRFYDERGGDWRDCFEYVRENFGYDKYPGNCHIIPNAAVMALSMLYGGEDFDRTLNICCMCGWDTDCNVGNVAAILGVLKGLSAINYDKWLAPINDGFAVSCALGCLNYMDAPWCAKYLVDLGYRLAGETPPEFELHNRVYDFALPNSTHSFESENARLTNPGGCLRIDAEGSAKVFRKTYHIASDFMDDRYSPEFTPEMFPGQTLSLRVRADGVKMRAFVEDIASEKIMSEETLVIGEQTLRLRLPRLENACIRRAGVIVDGGISYIDEIRFEGAPDYALDLTSRAQFTRWKGIFARDVGGMRLSCADEGAVFTGDIEWRDYRLEAHITPTALGECEILALVGGATRSVNVVLSPGALSIVENDMERRELARRAHEYVVGKEYCLAVECRGGRVTVYEDGEPALSAASERRQRGAIGFGVRGGGAMTIRRLSVSPL